MGTTPEHGQATPPNELPDLLAIEEESSQLRTNAQLAGNIDPTNTMRTQLPVDDHGTPMRENGAQIYDLLFKEFPIFAGGILIEQAVNYFAPEEKVALYALVKAKKLFLHFAESKAGKIVITILKMGKNGGKEEIAEAELRKMLKEAYNGKRPPLHHLATNKNWKSMLRGGPWSNALRRLSSRRRG